jgi:hypothetical protein
VLGPRAGSTYISEQFDSRHCRAVNGDHKVRAQKNADICGRELAIGLQNHQLQNDEKVPVSLLDLRTLAFLAAVINM